MKVAKVNFNDVIGSDLFFGGISEQFVRYCVEGPSSFDPAATPTYPEVVELHFFNCPGGEVYEGYALYSYFRSLASQGVKIKAYIHALCASIASLVVLAADERYIGPLGSVMIHKPLVDAGPWANADDHRKAAEMLDQIEGQITGVYTTRTTIDAATLPDLMRAETTFGYAAAIENGFATGMIPEALVATGEPVAKVLNYAKVPLTPTPAPMAKLTEVEEQSLFEKFTNWLKPKNEQVAVQPTTPPAPPVVTNASEEVTDNDPLYYADGTDLAVDTAVYSDAELTVAYADGDYTLVDGRTISVAAGLVTALADAATSDNAEEVATNNATKLVAENEALKQQLAELTASNQLTERKLTAANNKLKQVPGSAGDPTPPGSVQNMATTKPGTPKNSGGLMFSLTQPSTSNRK